MQIGVDNSRVISAWSPFQLGTPEKPLRTACSQSGALLMPWTTVPIIPGSLEEWGREGYLVGGRFRVQMRFWGALVRHPRSYITSGCVRSCEPARAGPRVSPGGEVGVFVRLCVCVG